MPNQGPFRIAFVAEDYPPNPGGAAEVSQNLVEEFVRQGHHVHVVAPHVQGDAAFDKAIKVHTTRIGQLNIRRKKLGIVARYKAVSEFQNQIDLWLQENTRAHRFDFALVSSVSVWGNVCHKNGIPYGVFVHGSDGFGKRQDFIRSLYRRFAVKRICANARRIFTNSNYTAKMLDSKYGFAGKTITTYCGVSKRFIAAANTYDKLNFTGNGNLLMMCRLVDIKACDVVIRAIAVLSEKYPQITLNIAGDGPLLGELRGLADELGVSENIRFLGYVEELGVKARLFAEADIYVQSGRIDLASGRAEAFGVVYAEAGACCIPAIGPRIGGVKEVIDHGRTGLLVEPDDHESMARAIDELLSDKECLTRMGEAGYQKVKTQFNYEVIAKKITDELSWASESV